MSTNNDELLQILREIHDILSRIYTCFEDQYLEIQKQKVGEKLETLENMLTPVRRRIYPLLFDTRRLSQTEIADKANTTQPTVSRFISVLLAEDLIRQSESEDGIVVYRNKYDLAKLI